MTTATWIRFVIYFSLSQYGSQEQSEPPRMTLSRTDCFWGPDTVDRLPGPWTRYIVTTSLGFAREGVESKERDGCIRKIKMFSDNIVWLWINYYYYQLGLIITGEKVRSAKLDRGGSVQLQRLSQRFSLISSYLLGELVINRCTQYNKNASWLTYEYDMLVNWYVTYNLTEVSGVLLTKQNKQE